MACTCLSRNNKLSAGTPAPQAKSQARKLRSAQLPAHNFRSWQNLRPAVRHLAALVRNSATTNAPAMAKQQQAFQPSKPTLFDVPVSNNGARCRYVIYKKQLEGEVDITSPQTLGGLKSEQYLALNAQGKMPMLVLPDGTALPESEVINQYLVEKYKDQGPSLIPATPELRAKAALLTRFLDLYINSVQGCMYKAMPAERRAAELAQINTQLDILEGLASAPYIAGNEPSTADAALFPTFVFMTYMLPFAFGWDSVFKRRPKLQAWWNHIQSDDAASRVIAEIREALDSWKAADRWVKQGILEQVADKQHKWTF
ncbi:hypothetical protein WJX72_006815 [[Myrmecia] bisecta]|uniref:Glutathione S-transferase n=1 Tax=[Myrmecia] bisecta TaxID=41462 RepID=A0AAW1PK27_9CHLO